METIIIILGVVLLIDNLFKKWWIWYNLEQFANRTDYKILNQLAQCQFCVLFWIGVVVSAVYGLATEINLTVCLAPIVVSGLLTIKPKQ